MTKFINATSLDDTIDRLWFDQMLGVGYYTIIAIMAIVGNIFIIHATSLIRGRTMDLMTISLIRTLAVNDLVGGLILYPHFIILLSLGRFPSHWVHCILLGICEIYFPLVSTLLVLTLVITKVAMIRDPFLCMKGPKRIYVTVACLYLIGTLTPLGAFVHLGDYMFSPERGTCTYNFYPTTNIKKIYVMVCTMLFVIIPLVVIIALSVYILRFVKKHRTTYSAHGALQDAKEAAAKSKSKALANRERLLKSVMVVLLVVIAYILCWSMFFCVTTIAYFMKGEKKIPAAVLLWQKALLMTNNALNPIVYIISNKKLQLIFFKTKDYIKSLLSCQVPGNPSHPIIPHPVMNDNTNVSIIHPVEEEKRTFLLSTPAIIKSMKIFTAKAFNKEEVGNGSAHIINVSANNLTPEYRYDLSASGLKDEQLNIRAESQLCNSLPKISSGAELEA